MNRRGRTLLGAGLALLVVLGVGSCAATHEEPEILGVEYKTKVSGAGVQDVTSAQLPSAEQAPPAVGEAPTFAQENTLRVLDIRQASDGGGSRIVVQLSRSPANVHPFELTGPRRCVVDLNGPAVPSHAQQVLETQDRLVPRLRVGNYSDHVRLVAEVAPNVVGPCLTDTKDTAVVLALGDRPVAAKPEVVWTAASSPDGAIAHSEFTLANAAGLAAPPTAVASSEPPTAPHREPTEVAQASPPRDEPAARERGPRVGSPPPAPPPPPPELPSSVVPASSAQGGPHYKGRRVSLEFKDADILNVLRVIADVAHKNIVATDDVKGRVTIVLYDVPWDQALDILLRSTGLEQVEYDDVITVSTSKRLEEERRARIAAKQAGQDLESLHTEYLRINYVKAADLAAILRGTTSNALAAANAAVAINQSNQSGEQRTGLLSWRGTVQVNEATNTLIVRDVADGIANAKELVRKLDVQTPQVAIQGLIFEADTNIERSLGIQWGAKYIASPETGNPTGKNFPGRVGIGGAGPTTSGGTTDASGNTTGALPLLFDFPASGVGPGAGSTLGLLLGSLSGSSTIDAQLTALEQAGKGKVVSRPKVITLNNAEATIQSLEILRVRLPSTGTVINTGAGGTAGGQTVATQAIDTGIILRVTPQVSSDGYVLMQMFVKSSVPSQQKTDDIPNEISRQATSQVLVREGETVVIGGVYRERANKAESGVPYLRTIPVLGWLFKNDLNTDDRQELLVFITPRIVWRTGTEKGLPTATELWEKRAIGAYGIDPGAEGKDAVPAMPQSQG